MAEISGDARAGSVLRVMRAALTMRRDRTQEAVSRLDWGQLRTLQEATLLLSEETASEIIRRKRR